MLTQTLTHTETQLRVFTLFNTILRDGRADGLIDQRTDGQTKSFTELRTYAQLKSVIVWSELRCAKLGGSWTHRPTLKNTFNKRRLSLFDSDWGLATLERCREMHF